MNTCLELNYNNFIDKAKREIDRLRKAENELDPVAALDHALNCCFHCISFIRMETKSIVFIGKRIKEPLKERRYSF